MKCDNCKGKKTSPAQGNCSSCGARTSNRQAKYCGKCSQTKGCCSQCGKSVSGGAKSSKKD